MRYACAVFCAHHFLLLYVVYSCLVYKIRAKEVDSTS